MQEQQTHREAYERRRMIASARDRAVRELGSAHELTQALEREYREATKAGKVVYRRDCRVTSGRQ